MENSANQWTDQRLEIIIGNLLRAGVLVSAGVVAVGAALFLARHGGEIPQYRHFHSQPEEFRSIAAILRNAFSFHGRNIIQFGLLLLIATPVARVAFSILAFGLERDRMYVGFTLIVLAVLVFSLAGGHL